MKRLFWIYFVLLTAFLQAQEIPVTWSIDANHVDGTTYDLVFVADIDKGWNVYSQFIGEGGPIPTSVTYESEGHKLVGKSQETGDRKAGMDPIFEMDLIKFTAKKPYTITQRIDAGSSKKVSGYLTFMACDNSHCIPPTDIDFSLALTGSGGQEDRAAVTPPSEPSKLSESKETSPIAQQPPTPTTAVVKADVPPSRPESGDLSSSIMADDPSLSWIKILDKESPVTWSYAIAPISEETYKVFYKADISDGWTVYSQHLDDGGPIPTSVTYDQKVTTSDNQEKGYKKEGLDPYFDINVVKYLDKEPFVVSEVITSKEDKVTGYLTYMACDDKQCLPPTDVNFGFDLTSGVAYNTSAEVAETTSFADNTENISAAGLISAIKEGGRIDQTREKLRETHVEPLSSCGSAGEKRTGLSWMFLFGFLGGLLALLTPCVFPIIPMTVSFFTKDTKRKGWVSGLIYGASIVVIYVTIGLAITALFGEEALNSLSTSWIANTLFFVIFVFFAFSFFGFYELTLPSSWTTQSDKMADKGGLIGIFFMAFTLALVSFSCTGPIIGAALVESASNQVGPFVVMLGFSLGLAIPFGLFAAFPAWLNSLPQSGGWMNSVKVTLGFIELALAFKFLTVADLTSHWGILKYEVFIGLWILIALAMAAYGMGWIKFPHDSPIKKISVRRYVYSIASLVFAVYLGSGFIYNDEIKSYNPLNLMSGIAPPTSYNLFLDDPKDLLDTNIKAKFPSYGKCANNINCFKDYFEGMAYAQEVGKPVFLDHTGHGCVNCRRTEDNIWSDNRIRSMLNDDYVLVSLYVDDREKLENILISEKRNKKLRTVGNRWADFQIVNFDQITQPLYVMVTPEEEVMTEPREYKEGVEDYFNYLSCGLETFRKNAGNSGL